MSAHDLAVALGIETDLVAPVPAATFESWQEALARYLQERLVVSGEERQCAAAAPALDYAFLPEDLLITLRYHCPAPVVRLRIRYALFFDLDPTHRSLGHVILPRRAELLWWTRQKWYEPSAGAASTAILLVALWWVIQRTAAS